ncbi:transglutaminase family protein [Coraliomargarita akajimensis]|uniref:transglutaminase family protein n=1 Tax=Coraliomargarita akajimensis TaxID=395922 RepID=UPI0002FFDA4F|nr:transglutaminase family protein [Coraliomargarita akajimensis]
MRVRIKHLTKHCYDAPVSFSDHQLYLRPLGGYNRNLEHFTLKTTPWTSQRWLHDIHGNAVLSCNFGLRESKELSFEVDAVVDLAELNPYDFILEPHAIAYPFNYTEAEAYALRPYIENQTKRGAMKVLDWFYMVVSEPVQHSSVVSFLSEFNEVIRREISYQSRDEEGIQTPDTTLALRTGSCRDMAVLFIEVVRQLGFAARFVSGYLYDPPVGSGGEHAFNRAVGAMHAWAEVYLPGAGWKGFDPTNGILANHYFIPCAVSHDPQAVNPIQGTYFSKESVRSEIQVDLSIKEICDDEE